MNPLSKNRNFVLLLSGTLGMLCVHSLGSPPAFAEEKAAVSPAAVLDAPGGKVPEELQMPLNVVPAGSVQKALRPPVPGLEAAGADPAMAPDKNSLIADALVHGALGYLSYEVLAPEKIRFRYEKRDGARVGHFWNISSLDLRRCRIYFTYSGITPKFVTLEFARSRHSAAAVYELPLEISETPRTWMFEIPDHKPFDDITVIQMWIHPGKAGARRADFTLEELSYVWPKEPVRD